jgi:hypothetical protein
MRIRPMMAPVLVLVFLGVAGCHLDDNTRHGNNDHYTSPNYGGPPVFYGGVPYYEYGDRWYDGHAWHYGYDPCRTYQCSQKHRWNWKNYHQRELKRQQELTRQRQLQHQKWEREHGREQPGHDHDRYTSPKRVDLPVKGKGKQYNDRRDRTQDHPSDRQQQDAHDRNKPPRQKQNKCDKEKNKHSKECLSK